MLKIGVGPSSSHTLSPWRAAEGWIKELIQSDVFDEAGKISIDLCDSLSLTGKGHAERNAMGAIKAINTAELALVKVVATMWETAKDVNSKYKETSEVGFAVGVNMTDC